MSFVLWIKIGYGLKIFNNGYISCIPNGALLPRAPGAEDGPIVIDEELFSNITGEGVKNFHLNHHCHFRKRFEFPIPILIL